MGAKLFSVVPAASPGAAALQSADWGSFGRQFHQWWGCQGAAR